MFSFIHIRDLLGLKKSWGSQPDNKSKFSPQINQEFYGQNLKRNLGTNIKGARAREKIRKKIRGNII
jgi:hypothetical protein